MGQMRNTYRILVGGPEGKRSLKTPDLMENNIKMDRRNYTVRVWIRQYPMKRLVCTVMKQWVPQEARIFLRN
jgi:hypothetical protein